MAWLPRQSNRWEQKEVIFMKKLSIAMLVLLILLAGCGGNSETPEIPGIEPDSPEEIGLMSNLEANDVDENNIAQDISESNADSTEATDLITNTDNIDSEVEFEKYRLIYYNLPVPFANLVGHDVYLDWYGARSTEERDNECAAVSFIKYFDITQREFERANEELRELWTSVDASPEKCSNYEIYPVELIFTFNNELINEYFLWENSPAHEERSIRETLKD